MAVNEAVGPVDEVERRVTPAQRQAAYVAGLAEERRGAVTRNDEQALADIDAELTRVGAGATKPQERAEKRG